MGESCRLPLQYYQNNITGTSILLEVMADNEVYNLVYSSSATVYGEPQFLPLTEDHPTGNCTNPYGKSKYFSEEIMKDLCVSDKVRQINVDSLQLAKSLLHFSAGTSFHFAISTPLDRMTAGASAKTPTASPTISCHTFRKSLWES